MKLQNEIYEIMILSRKMKRASGFFCRKNQGFSDFCPRVWILQGIPQQQKDTLICRLVSFTFQKKNNIDVFGSFQFLAPWRKWPSNCRVVIRKNAKKDPWPSAVLMKPMNFLTMAPIHNSLSSLQKTSSLCCAWNSLDSLDHSIFGSSKCPPKNARSS